MSHLQATTRVPIRADTSNPTNTGLRGSWLVLVRCLWIVCVLGTFVIYIASIPIYIAQLRTLCRSASCATGQLSPVAAQTLHTAGISITAYVALWVIVEALWALVWFVVAGVLAWRKSNDWMALLVALMLIMEGAVSVTNTVAASHSIWQFPTQFVNFLAFALLVLVFALFPDGRFVPRWICWFVIAFLVESVIFNFFPNVSFLANSWLNALGNVVWIGCLVSLAIAQIYRYLHISTPIQRQQMKWVVYGFALIILSLLGVLILQFLFPPLAQPGSLFSLAFGSDANVFLLLIPLSIGIAILRYRLYDIDILINRTLVYGTLTVLLAVVYIGSIVLLQQLFLQLTGQRQSSLVTVISTLAIAALFQPLRARIQGMIDRRFYRRKYNAARTLADFSATLREQVDLEQLSERLVAVVEETMQPAHVSLWLRKSGQERKPDTRV
ncbi:MAG TPA: hypothetical protein VF043_16335 [Ktedonobacteraceae bacterium]